MQGRLRRPPDEAARAGLAGRTGTEVPTREAPAQSERGFVWGWAADARQAMIESRPRPSPMSTAFGSCKPATPRAPEANPRAASRRGK
jgi:hypothetical protein